MPESIAVSVKNVSKQFDNVEVLRDINLTVEKGTVVSILGSSGSGKSTLLRCMNWLEQPDRGEIHIGGQRLGIDEQRGRAMSHRQLAKIRERVGMVFQSFNLWPHLTVQQNVSEALLRVKGMKRDEAKAMAMQQLEKVGMAHKADVYPITLSGGQKQRVAIARALATNPHYLLCDEATSALDPTTTDSILALLQTINRTLGVTVVVITHEMAVVDRICHRVAVIDNSRIVEMGAVDAIFANPRSAIARELILPHVKVAATVRGGAHVRLAFNGESTYKPLVSALILETGVPVSILFADTRDIGGKTYGQILLELPGEDRLAQRVTAWLDANFPSYSLEV